MPRITSISLESQFDREWYSATYLDVKLLEMDPEDHYQYIGRYLGRPPNSGARSTLRKSPTTDQSFEWLGEHSSAHNGPAVVIPDAADPNFLYQGSLAIHLHLFHHDMLDECCRWLSSVPVPYDLFVSVVGEKVVEEVQRSLSEFGNINRLFVDTFPNKGRDIAPMVAGFGKQLSKYDFIGHLHTKKSSHTREKRDWSVQLGHHLFHSQEHTASLLNIFANNSDVGVIFPVYHPSIKDQIRWGGNYHRVASEMKNLTGLSYGEIMEKDLLPFPAGSFFIARTDAILPLLDGAFTFDDFESEENQVDGTLAHAIERMFVLVAARRGYSFQQVRAEKPHSLSRAYLRGHSYHSEFLDKIDRGARSSLPRFSDPDLAGLRITVFTCSTGGYDHPLPFESFLEGADYVFFTDQRDLERDGHWRISPLAATHNHQIKTARRHKTQAHRILQDTDIAIWIDANVAITGDITSLILKVLRDEASFGVIAHPYRTSVEEELTALEQLRIDDPGVMRPQIERYKAEGFQDDGLTETNFLIMDLRREETRTALDIWWSEIEHNSRRDQLSFDYSCWKAGAKKLPLLINGLSVRADYRFAYFDHGGAEHTQLHTKPALEALWTKGHPAHALSESLSVDVVVCVHNSPDDVARCLHSLALARDGRTRIIVVDDGSDTPTRAIIDKHLFKHPSDLLIRHKSPRGYTKSANVGMRESRADYVVLLNSDTIVPQGWVAALVHAGESDRDIGIVGPLSNAASWQSVPYATTDSGDYAINELPTWMSVDDVAAVCAKIPGSTVYRSPVVNGFCFAIKRRAIELIGYLDEDAFPQGYGEENDYCLRLMEAGMSCGFTLSTYVYHAKSKSFNHERRRILSEEGWNQLVEKHGKEVLARVVNEMKDNSALARARNWFNALTTTRNPPVNVIAFYLPQFHSFDFNDAHWGAGFSEWRNVVKAQPRFDEHYQPRLPGELGYYDLRTTETLDAQGRLANQYGVFGMGIYYYRFGSERLMSAPTDRLLQTPRIGPRFFYVWANEDWTRAWDGRTKDIIKKQDHSFTTIRQIAYDIAEAAADSRYIRIEGRPVFMIYQLNLLPDPLGMIQYLRESVRDILGIELVIGTTWNPKFRSEWEDLVDFIVQFPPHRTPRLSQRMLMPRESVRGASEMHADYLESYDEVAAQSIAAMDTYGKLAPGVCPDWDNSARRAKNANILVGATPAKFERWTKEAATKAATKYLDGKLPAPLLFVNAWNEWAEGAVLEPTEKHGRLYLDALRRGVFADKFTNDKQ